MAAVPSINGRQVGAFAAALTVLTSSDTITIDDRFKQILVLRNPTGGPLTLVIDGAGSTNVNAPGLGNVVVSAGYSIAVPAGESRAVDLASIRAYLDGVVTMTGAAGMVAQLFNF